MICCPHCRKHFAVPVPHNRPEVLRLQECVAAHYNLPTELLWLPGKRADVSEARQVAIYALGQLTSLTKQEIGSAFNRDRTTVAYTMAAVQERLPLEKRFSGKVETLLHLCAAALSDNNVGLVEQPEEMSGHPAIDRKLE